MHFIGIAMKRGPDDSSSSLCSWHDLDPNLIVDDIIKNDIEVFFLLSCTSKKLHEQINASTRVYLSLFRANFIDEYYMLYHMATTAKETDILGRIGQECAANGRVVDELYVLFTYCNYRDNDTRLLMRLHENSVHDHLSIDNVFGLQYERLLRYRTWTDDGGDEEWMFQFESFFFYASTVKAAHASKEVAAQLSRFYSLVHPFGQCHALFYMNSHHMRRMLVLHILTQCKTHFEAWLGDKDSPMWIFLKALHRMAFNNNMSRIVTMKMGIPGFHYDIASLPSFIEDKEMRVVSIDDIICEYNASLLGEHFRAAGVVIHFDAYRVDVMEDSPHFLTINAHHPEMIIKDWIMRFNPIERPKYFIDRIRENLQILAFGCSLNGNPDFSHMHDLLALESVCNRPSFTEESQYEPEEGYASMNIYKSLFYRAVQYRCDAAIPRAEWLYYTTKSARQEAKKKRWLAHLHE